jgi:hypothetical protein
MGRGDPWVAFFSVGKGLQTLPLRYLHHTNSFPSFLGEGEKNEEGKALRPYNAIN